MAQIEDLRILANDPFLQIGSAAKIVKLFGSRDDYTKAVADLINEIYAA